VLAGAEKLSDVEEQEAKLLKDCGYFTKNETKPVIRLACKAVAAGNVSEEDLELLQIADSPEQAVEMVVACTTGTCSHVRHQRPLPLT